MKSYRRSDRSGLQKVDVVLTPRVQFTCDRHTSNAEQSPNESSSPRRKLKRENSPLRPKTPGSCARFLQDSPLIPLAAVLAVWAPSACSDIAAWRSWARQGVATSKLAVNVAWVKPGVIHFRKEGLSVFWVNPLRRELSSATTSTGDRNISTLHINAGREILFELKTLAIFPMRGHLRGLLEQALLNGLPLNPGTNIKFSSYPSRAMYRNPCGFDLSRLLKQSCARRVAVYENYKLRAEDLPLKGVYRGRLVVNFENINDISSTL